MQETQSSARAQKIKDHFSKHRELYIRSGLVVGTAVFSTALTHAMRPMAVTANGEQIAAVAGRNVIMKDNVVMKIVIKPGNSGDVLWDPRNKVLYLSKNEAMRALGITWNTLKKKLADGDLLEVINGTEGFVPKA